MLWGKRALIIWCIVGIAVLFYSLGIALNVLAIPLGIILWTVIIVFLLRWGVETLAERGFSRLAATSISYLAFLGILVVFGWFMFSPVFNVGDQFQSFISGAPDYFEQVVALVTDAYGRYSSIADNPTVASVVEDVSASATEFVRNLASSSVESLFQATSITASLLLCFMFGLIVAFWLLLEMPGLEREMHRLTAGAHAEDFHFFHETMSRAVGGYIRATLLQCGLIALICMIAFYILSVPNPVALALVVGVVNIIPVVGPWIAAIAVFLSLAFSNMLTALLATLITVVVQRVIYTFVSPKLMGDSVDVHPALVIIAMMIGLAIGTQVGGIMGSLVGMLLSIPFAAVAKATFVYYFEKRTGRRLVAEDGVLFKGSPAGSGVNPAHDAVAPRRPSIKVIQAQKELKRANRKKKSDKPQTATPSHSRGQASGQAATTKQTQARNQAAEQGQTQAQQQTHVQERSAARNQAANQAYNQEREHARKELDDRNKY